MDKKIKINSTHIMLALVVATALVMSINSYQLSKIAGKTTFVTAETKVDLAGGLSFSTPTGTPKIYGKELQVSYDDVDPYDPVKANTVIKKLGDLDRSITLNEEQKQRYINILYKMNNGISCEYCCGARAIIFENGQPACGCAHSYAMRGLTKYLITKHGNEFSDEEMLAEVGKWKSLFFPNQIANKAKLLEENGLETDIVSLTSNKYRGIEKQLAGGNAGGMVGGC